jgi:hypothetical protein
MDITSESKDIKSGSLILIISFAIIKLIIHLVTNTCGGYGIFRDELYYIACSNHLDIGYVDHPPLSLYILSVSRLLFGDSIFGLRLLPAIAGTVTVFLSGIIARELGGKKFAQALTCIATIISPIFLSYNAVYSMNAFDVVLWTLAAYVVIRLVKTGLTVHWLLLGIIIGLGTFNKIGMLFWGVGITLGFLLTSHRTWFKKPQPYIAASIALLIFLPYIIWNVTHDFAHLEFIRNATGEKYSGLTPISFIIGQILLQNPVALPLWLAGLYFFFFHHEGKKIRVLGYAYLVAFLILIINGHSKPEYLAAAYAVLFAGGGVAFEEWFSKQSLRLLKPVYVVILSIGIFAAPMVLPILPVETYIRYANALGVSAWTQEGKQLEKLPQFYADMFGWEDKAAAVAKVFHSLSLEDQAKCAIFGDNYGRSGAIDFYSKKYELPFAIGRHNNYWLWGPGSYDGELIIILGGALEDKQRAFESVEIAGTVHSEYCMPYENELNIYICRELKITVPELWESRKIYE